MAEYIDRETAIKELGYYPAAQEYIKDIPAADVAPVLHGRWKRYGKNLGECSEGGEVVAIRNNFCPHCGAKMDGNVNDQ